MPNADALIPTQVDLSARNHGAAGLPVMSRMSCEEDFLLRLTPAEDYFLPIYECGALYMDQCVPSYAGLPGPPKKEQLLLSFDGTKQTFISADTFVPRRKKLLRPRKKLRPIEPAASSYSSTRAMREKEKRHDPVTGDNSTVSSSQRSSAEYAPFSVVGDAPAGGLRICHVIPSPSTAAAPSSSSTNNKQEGRVGIMKVTDPEEDSCTKSCMRFCRGTFSSRRLRIPRSSSHYSREVHYMDDWDTTFGNGGVELAEELAEDLLYEI